MSAFLEKIRGDAFIGAGDDHDGVGTFAVNVDEGHAGRGAADPADVLRVHAGCAEAVQLHFAEVVVSDAAEHGGGSGRAAKATAGDSLVCALAAV